MKILQNKPFAFQVFGVPRLRGSDRLKAELRTIRDTADCQSAPRCLRRSAFTMIEIALCLAIIGFALVAIIGVLPRGLKVQEDNRQETIIDQDAAVWMNAIRNGAHGFDDLTNYVIGITNYWANYDGNGNKINGNEGNDGYSYAGSVVTSIGPPRPFVPLTNGLRIIGLLSTPKRLPQFGNPFQSNYVVAYVRAMSGSVVDKAPQNDPTVLESAFSYKMIAEVVPYVPFQIVDLSLTNFTTAQLVARTNQARVNLQLQNNSTDLRLSFVWPLLPGNKFGNGRQTFRLLTGGQIVRTNDFIEPGQRLFFLEPSTYANVLFKP